MENWIIYYDPRYDAQPWPFAQPWDQWLQSPQDLPHTCADFGRAAVCDGLSETPSVPANLPRLLPGAAGHHRMAIYHDPQNLYVFLDSQAAPPVVTADHLQRVPHLAGVPLWHATFALLTADERLYYLFTIDANGKKSARLSPMIFGPRKLDPPAGAADKIDFDARTFPRAHGELICWRIARTSIPDVFTGPTLRASLTRMHLPSIETVAWGSATVWGPRPDEFPTVHLQDRPVTPPYPRLQRVDMQYNPHTEQAQFTLRYAAPFRNDEDKTSAYIDRNRVTPWETCALRLNEVQHLFPLTENVQSPPLDLLDGHNLLHITTVGGPATRLFVEKRSGNRIVIPKSAPAQTPTPPAVAPVNFRGHLDHELSQLQQEFLTRQAAGPLTFRGFGTYKAASVARAFHYFQIDPKYLELIRAEADLTVSLQRPDGSFAGFHLERFGRPPSPWAGGAFDSGPAGELWAVAAQVFKDDRYLDASARLLKAYQHYRVEFNYNYAAFALFHLAAHYRLTRDPEALAQALYYTQHCVAIDLLPLGFHAGHNYYGCYGAFTLRGLAGVCLLLPDDHSYKPTLRELCIRMTNQVIIRQQPDGAIESRDRNFITERYWLWGLFTAAFLLPPDDVARLDTVIQRMCHSAAKARGLDPLRFLDSDAVRYFAHREALLTGKPIDPFDLF